MPFRPGGGGELRWASVADAPVELTCAGRTDAGVHAREPRSLHFDTAAARNPRAWLLGTNSALPPTVNLRWVQPVSDAFPRPFSAPLRRSVPLRGAQPANAFGARRRPRAGGATGELDAAGDAGSGRRSRGRARLQRIPGRGMPGARSPVRRIEALTRAPARRNWVVRRR